MSLSQGFTEDSSGNTVVSGTVSANQGGTWTVQPGNTANTTAWKVDGSAVTQPVSGTVTITSIPTGGNVIGHVINDASSAVIGHVIVDSGSITSTLPTSATGTLTSVTSSITSGTMLASNASRKGFMVYNDSTSIAYMAFTASAATSSAYTVKLQPNSYYESSSPVYTGAITIIWASANGAARVTELT